MECFTCQRWKSSFDVVALDSSLRTFQALFGIVDKRCSFDGRRLIVVSVLREKMVAWIISIHFAY